MSYGTAMAKLRAAAPAVPETSLTCAAKGCPNVWSVDKGGGKLCSAHAWAELRDWPEITQRQQWLMQDRALQVEEPEPEEHVLLTRADAAVLAERLDQLYQLMLARHSSLAKSWAHDLRKREERGESLTLAQRSMWRAALGRGGASAGAAR